MMARGAVALAAVLTLLTPLDVPAQPLLTLEEALHAAVAQNASLRATQAAATAAEAHVRVARAALFPRLALTEGWSRGDDPVFVFSSRLSAREFAAPDFAIPALNEPAATGFFQARVSLEQIVFDGGRRRSSTDAARLRADQASSGVDEAEAQLAVAVAQAFGRILASQAAADAARAALDAGREDLRRAEGRRDAGLATDADVLSLVVHVADVEQRAIAASGDAAVARAELNRLMGTDVARDFRAAEPTTATTNETRDISTLTAAAERGRPDLRRAAAQIRLAEAAARGARAAFVPEVAAQADVLSSGLRFGDRRAAWLVGASFRWMLSAGGAEAAGVAAARASVDQARAEYESARAAIHVDVISAVRRLDTARARQAAGRAAVDQARESQRIVRDRFDAGMATVNDVLRAASAVLDAEANRSGALVDAIVADALLKRAIGSTP